MVCFVAVTIISSLTYCMTTHIYIIIKKIFKMYKCCVYILYKYLKWYIISFLNYVNMTFYFYTKFIVYYTYDIFYVYDIMIFYIILK